MIPATRRKEVLAWLDDRARDYSLNNRDIALAKDAAALIREPMEHGTIGHEVATQSDAVEASSR